MKVKCLIMNDAILLAEYAQDGAESPFRQLVERHLPMVCSVARRQLNDPGLAEDAAQGVFVLLARKAPELPPNTNVAGWLYRAARHVGWRMLRSEVRRKERDMKAVSLAESTGAEEAWPQLAPVLEEGMDELKQEDREALLLKFYQGLETKEVAKELGLSLEAAKKRVTRALGRLRGILASKGVSMPAVVLGAAMAAHALTSTGGMSTTGVADKALAMKMIPAAELPDYLEGLLGGLTAGTRKMGWMAAGIGAVLLMTTALLIVAKFARNRASQYHAPSAHSNAATASKTESFTKKATGSPNDQDETTLLHFGVVDAATGEPVKGARLGIIQNGDGESRLQFNLTTDLHGWCEVRYDAKIDRIDVGIIEDGWKTRTATWQPKNREPIPSHYIMKVERSTERLSGQIIDEGGNPVPNVHIEFRFFAKDRRPTEYRAGTEWDGFPDYIPTAGTDPDGRWHWNKGYAGHVYAFANAEEFVEIQFLGADMEEVDRARSGTLINVLQRQYTINGRVLGHKGQPLSAARVWFVGGEHWHETDSNGQFQVANIKRNPFLIVGAAGHAPSLFELSEEDASKTNDYQLSPGRLIRIEVSDPGDMPIIDARVELATLSSGSSSLSTSSFDPLFYSANTDQNGCVEWNHAPRDHEFTITITAEGYCESSITITNALTASDSLKSKSPAYKVILRPELLVIVSAIDAETRRPLDRFVAIPTSGLDSAYTWDYGNSRQGERGIAEITFRELPQEWHVRAEAEGYLPVISGPIDHTLKGTVEVRMERNTPDNSVEITVLDSQGKPVPGADVALATESNAVILHDEDELQFSYLFSKDTRLWGRTDYRGVVTLPRQEGRVIVDGHGGGGYALAPIDGSKMTIQLKPWAALVIESNDESVALAPPAILSSASLHGSFSIHRHFDEESTLSKAILGRLIPGAYSLTMQLSGARRTATVNIQEGDNLTSWNELFREAIPTDSDSASTKDSTALD